MASPTVLPGRPRRITTATLLWRGITIEVSLEPDWLGLAAAGHDGCAHLELQVLCPVGAPLPLGDDGYWSEFLAVGEAEDAGDAAVIALALLEEFSLTQTWRVRWAKWEQRELFGTFV